MSLCFAVSTGQVPISQMNDTVSMIAHTRVVRDCNDRLLIVSG